jgi:outer membrane lipoprotein-sorting protein
VLKLTTLLSVLLSFHLNAATPSGLEVMKKVQEHNKGFIGATSEMKMVLIDAHDNKVERVMTGEVIEDSESGDKSITAFKKPLDIKGTKLLTWTAKSGPNKQWLFLPKFKRVKKINARNQSGSFMGSEFSYEDVGGQILDKYTYKFISENNSEWVIESTPKEKSGYSKMITTISKKFTNPTKVEYFDRRGELLKISIIEEYKAFKVKGKSINMANKITMDNKQTKKKSVISWTKRKLGLKLKVSDFKSSKLK